MMVEESRAAMAAKITHHEVDAAPSNTCGTTCAHHRAAAANRRMPAGKSGMSCEASRPSTATLSPRRKREQCRAQGRNCEPANHTNIIALTASHKLVLRCCRNVIYTVWDVATGVGGNL